jgi:hypothetical protein
MTKLLGRISRAVAQLPERLLRAIRFAPEGSPRGYTDLDEIEAKRRREVETQRRGVDEEVPPGGG